MSEEGKDVSLWGKFILVCIGIIAYIVIVVIDGLESEAMKWFWMSFVVIALGFQSFIDWKYLKSSKQYIASLIVLVLGVTLVYLLI